MYDYKNLARSIIEENYDSSVLARFDKDAAKHFRSWEATPDTNAKNSDEVKTGGLEDPSNWDSDNIETYLRIIKAIYDFCKQVWRDLKTKDASKLTDEELEALNKYLEKELKEKGIPENEAKQITSKTTDKFREM